MSLVMLNTKHQATVDTSNKGIDNDVEFGNGYFTQEVSKVKRYKEDVSINSVVYGDKGKLIIR